MDLEEKIDDLKYKVERILQAMAGDTTTGAVGYGPRLKKVEEEIEVLKQEYNTRRIYTKQLVWVATAVGSSIVAYILSLIYKLWI